MSHIPLNSTQLRDIGRNKTVKIEGLNGFPAPVANVITLEADTNYEITQPIAMGLNQLKIPDDANITLSTSNTVVNNLTSSLTGSTPFITGAIARLAILGLDLLSDAGGECFDLTAGSGVVPILFMEANRIVGFDAIGTIDGVLFASENVGYLSNSGPLTINDSGLIQIAEQNWALHTGDHYVLTGTIPLAFFNTIVATPGSGDAVFNIDSGITTNSIQITNGALVTSGGGTWFDSAGLNQFDVGIKVSMVHNVPDSDRLVTKSTTYTVLTTDGTVKTSGTSAFTITLPTAVGVQGKEYTIDHEAAATITVAADGSELIAGVPFIQIKKGRPGRFPSITVRSDNVGWMIV